MRANKKKIAIHGQRYNYLRRRTRYPIYWIIIYFIEAKEKKGFFENLEFDEYRSCVTAFHEDKFTIEVTVNICIEKTCHNCEGYWYNIRIEKTSEELLDNNNTILMNCDKYDEIKYIIFFLKEYSF